MTRKDFERLWARFKIADRLAERLSLQRSPRYWLARRIANIRYNAAMGAYSPQLSLEDWISATNGSPRHPIAAD